MRRPKKDDAPTRDFILDAATQLFYSRGLRAVSLDEIAAAANLTKRTLYYHFATKDDLIVAYLSKWKDDSRVRHLTSPTDKPIAQLLAEFDRLAREVSTPKFRGCPFVNAVAEINDAGHAATQLALEHKDVRRKWFESLLKAAGIAQPAKLARQILVLWEGAMVRSLVTRSAAPVRDARDAVAALIGKAT